MKKLISLLFLMLISGISYATIINVDNNPNRPSGYYSNLQLAVNTASAGDTIYVYPSNTSYGDVTIKKKLHLFGSGYDGTSGSVTKVNSLYLDTATSPSSNSSGSTIQGFTFLSNVYCNKPNISNIVISGNYFYYSHQAISLHKNCSNWLITNNYFKGYLNIYNNNNIIISNNIFSNHSYNPIQSSNSNSVLISHNLFMYFDKFNYVYNATISDNIFICKTSYTGDYMSKNIFLNNLSYYDGALNNYNLPPTGNTGSGNLSNTNPQFVDGTLTGSYDISKDYHLQSSSPAKTAATDGTEIGPYGGSNPFVWGGAFTIPKITLTNITNPVINQSTPINVNVKANKAKL